MSGVRGSRMEFFRNKSLLFPAAAVLAGTLALSGCGNGDPSEAKSPATQSQEATPSPTETLPNQASVEQLDYLQPKYDAIMENLPEAERIFSQFTEYVGGDGQIASMPSSEVEKLDEVAVWLESAGLGPIELTDADVEVMRSNDPDVFRQIVSEKGVYQYLERVYNYAIHLDPDTRAAFLALLNTNGGPLGQVVGSMWTNLEDIPSGELGYTSFTGMVSGNVVFGQDTNPLAAAIGQRIQEWEENSVVGPTLKASSTYVQVAPDAFSSEQDIAMSVRYNSAVQNPSKSEIDGNLSRLCITRYEKNADGKHIGIDDAYKKPRDNEPEMAIRYLATPISGIDVKTGEIMWGKYAGSEESSTSATPAAYTELYGIVVAPATVDGKTVLVLTSNGERYPVQQPTVG